MACGGIRRGLWIAVLLWGCRESVHPSPESVETRPAPSSAATAEQPSREANEIAANGTAAAKQLEDKPGSAREQTRDAEVGRTTSTTSTSSTVTQALAAEPPLDIPPDSPDPHAGHFTLSEALEGLPQEGGLTATLRTSLGSFECKLFEDKAPITVANFVGLARGKRKFWSSKDRAWVARPYYDGTTFHRVIPGFMIQGGDWAGTGSGNMYYQFADELHPTLKHDRGGLLCMANRGPNTNAAQFFITERAARHLDVSYTIFGECSPVELVKRIARVPQAGGNNRPVTPVVIERVTIEREASASKKG